MNLVGGSWCTSVFIHFPVVSSCMCTITSQSVKWCTREICNMPIILVTYVIILYYFAAKKVSLADVGIVGGLSDGLDEREKGPPTTLYMGRAMGTGSGLGMYGGTPSQSTAGDDIFSNFGGQNYQFGGFQK